MTEIEALHGQPSSDPAEAPATHLNDIGHANSTKEETDGITAPEKSRLEGSVVDRCCSVVLKEARAEDRLVKQLVYALLSAYTTNPVNLAINAPTGTGKTHVIMRVVELFPKSDIVLLAGMTDKALFHRQGALVVKNELGEYLPVQDDLDRLDMEIREIEHNATLSSERTIKAKAKAAIELKEYEKKELLKDAKKLIDLSHKVLIFLDTPSPSLFAAIMPLLSHDAWEVEYDFVDTFHGIKTHSNVIRGWPAVIFAQAIDSSHHQRWPEIKRRFIITNPKMTDEKIRAAINLTADKCGLPDELYQKKVVSDAEKEIAKSHIVCLKADILKRTSGCKPGKNNVFIPFRETIEKSLPSAETIDMTVANRFFTWLSLLPIISAKLRPYLVMEESTCPFATFDDLKDALELVEYPDGSRPYVKEWFNDVFLPAYSEEQGAISTKQIADWIKSKKGKRMAKETIRKTYCEPLYNEGYLDREQNPDDKREHLYSPVAGRQGKLFEANKISVRDPQLFPDATKMARWIEESAPDATIIDAPDGNTALTISTPMVVDKYYNDPDQHFTRQN